MNNSTKPKPIIHNPFEQSFEQMKRKNPEVSHEESAGPEQTPVAHNVTKLDFDKLNSAYAGQDQSKLDALRGQLPQEAQEQAEKLSFHKKFKREEEEYYLKRKQEEEEKKRQEELAAEEKKRMEHEKNMDHGGALPEGKKRKNIFGGGSKKADVTETRPGKSKQ